MKKRIISIPPVYLILCVLADILLYLFFPSINLVNMGLMYVGLILLLLGLYISIYSYLLFLKTGTTVTYTKSQKMVIDGFYKYSRNPMYLGFLLIVWGISFLLGNVVGFVSPIVFFLIINYMFIPYEEDKMEKTFGKEYLQYKNKVRRWI